MKFENVIVGVDGRPHGRDAIALVRHLLAPGAKLTLANVHAGAAAPINAVTPGQVRAERDASKTLLEQERDAAGIEAELVSYDASSPGRGLHSLAEETGADLLVVGSCSRGRLGRVVIGDDTRAAMNGAPCAVAIAARGYAEHPIPIAAIGVGYNGTPESESALATARELAEREHATLRALNVVSIPTYAYTGFGTAIGEGIDEMLTEAEQQMAALEGVEGRAVYGLPGEELAALGSEVQLLVVGSRGYGPVRRLIIGTTSDYLQRNARCSLLVLTRRGD